MKFFSKIQSVQTTRTLKITHQNRLVKAKMTLLLVMNKLCNFVLNERFIFPERQCGQKQRSIVSSWFTKYNWLHYDQENDSVFCVICIRQQDQLSSEHQKTDTFINKGFINWKKATTSFNTHLLSSCHKTTVSYESVVPKCGDVGEMMVSELSKQRQSERRYLIKIMECLQYLARQGLAIRGTDDELENNLTQLLMLLCKREPDILQRVTTKQLQSWAATIPASRFSKRIP